jgi:hypothetical protein
MALQLGALRDALAKAGASKDKADKAAEEVATFDSRIAAIDSRLTVLTWMTGTVVGLSLLLVVCDLVEARGHQRATGNPGQGGGAALMDAGIPD